MKLAIITFATAAFFVSSRISAEEFSCEKIKQKSVRESCVKSRNDSAKEKAEKAAKEIDQKFIERAKYELTRNFKDPGSAQYRSTFVVSNEAQQSKVLCGEVNAKNSYGGYVGGKLFYVRWTQGFEDEKIPMTVWMNDGSESGALLKSGLDMMKAWCDGTHEGDKVTPVPQ